jgi:hypothetical protein
MQQCCTNKWELYPNFVNTGSLRVFFQEWSGYYRTSQKVWNAPKCNKNYIEVLRPSNDHYCCRSEFSMHRYRRSPSEATLTFLWQSRSPCSCVHKDQHPWSEVAAIKILNLYKCTHTKSATHVDYTRSTTSCDQWLNDFLPSSMSPSRLPLTR